MRTKHRDMLEEIMAEAEKKKLQQQLLAAANQAALQVPSEEPHVLTEAQLAESVRELLTLLVDETTLKAFGESILSPTSGSRNLLTFTHYL